MHTAVKCGEQLASKVLRDVKAVFELLCSWSRTSLGFSAESRNFRHHLRLAVL